MTSPRRETTAMGSSLDVHVAAACSGPRFHHEAARSRRGWGRPRSGRGWRRLGRGVRGPSFPDHVIDATAARLLVALLLLDLLDHVALRGVRRVQILVFAKGREPRLAPLPLIFKRPAGRRDTVATVIRRRSACGSVGTISRRGCPCRRTRAGPVFFVIFQVIRHHPRSCWPASPAFGASVSFLRRLYNFQHRGRSRCSRD